MLRTTRVEGFLWTASGGACSPDVDNLTVTLHFGVVACRAKRGLACVLTLLLQSIASQLSARDAIIFATWRIGRNFCGFSSSSRGKI